MIRLCHTTQGSHAHIFFLLNCTPLNPTLYCAVTENIHTHPKEGNWKFLGGGVSQAKNFKGKYGATSKLEIPGGGCSNQKTFCGGYGYFLEPHITMITNIYFMS